MSNLLLRRRMLMQAGGSPTPPEGAIPFPFSVSASKQVYFSQGNLQWSATGGGTTPTTHVTADGVGEGTWRFAENQWDFIGNNNSGTVYGVGGDMTVKCSNVNIGQNYQGWIDLIGFGTSGYNNVEPWFTTDDRTRYPNQNIDSTNFDWGVYNAISNGGNAVGLWRVLSRAEYNYIIANSQCGLANVNGVLGMMILSDDFVLPVGLSFSQTIANFTTNVYSIAEFELLEQAGAMFIPASGCRQYKNVSVLQSRGYYVSTTYYGGQYSYNHQYGTNKNVTEEDRLWWGVAVRLVHDIN